MNLEITHGYLTYDAVVRFDTRHRVFTVSIHFGLLQGPGPVVKGKGATLETALKDLSNQLHEDIPV